MDMMKSKIEVGDVDRYEGEWIKLAHLGTEVHRVWVNSSIRRVIESGQAAIVTVIDMDGNLGTATLKIASTISRSELEALASDGCWVRWHSTGKVRRLSIEEDGQVYGQSFMGDSKSEVPVLEEYHCVGLMEDESFKLGDLF